MEKKATRESYGEALVMLAEKRNDLVVLHAVDEFFFLRIASTGAS